MLVVCPRCNMPGCLRPYRWKARAYKTYWRVIHYIGRGRWRYHYISKREALALIASDSDLAHQQFRDRNGQPVRLNNHRRRLMVKDMLNHNNEATYEREAIAETVITKPTAVPEAPYDEEEVSRSHETLTNVRKNVQQNLMEEKRGEKRDEG